MLIGVINMFVFEWYVFGESMMMYGFAMLFAVEGALLWCREAWSLGRKTAVSFVLFLLAINSYQAILSWYILIALWAVLLAAGFRCGRKEWASGVLILGIGGVNCVLNQVIVKVLAALEVINQPGRVATLSLSQIISNLKAILSAQKMLWVDGYHLLPHGFMAITFGLSLLVLLVVIKKRGNGLTDCLVMLLALGMGVGLVFLPQLVNSTGVWLAHRTVTGVWVAAALMLGTCVLLGERPTVRCAAALIGVLLVANGLMVVKLERNLFLANELDIREADAVLETIAAYEGETGSRVDNICLLRDTSITVSNPAVYACYDINTRAGIVDWTAVTMLQVRSGRGFHVISVSPEQADAVVQQRNWSNFVPEEQLVFDGNTMYYIRY